MEAALTVDARNASGVMILSRITDCPDYPMKLLLLDENCYKKCVSRLSGFHCINSIALTSNVMSS